MTDSDPSKTRIVETPDEDPRDGDPSDLFGKLYSTILKCESCGHTWEPDGFESCPRCKERMVEGVKELHDTTEYVPVEVLEDLLRQWRAKQEREALPRSGLTGEGAVIKGCADDLERVIEQHE